MWHLEWLLPCPWLESCESSDILEKAVVGTICTNCGLNSSDILKSGD